jgi:hypothetical protein
MLPNLALQQLHRSIVDISESAFPRPQHWYTAWSTHPLSLHERPSLHIVSIRDATGRKHRCLLRSNSKRSPKFLKNFILANPQIAAIDSVWIVRICCKSCAICGCRLRDSETWLATEVTATAKRLWHQMRATCDASCFSNKRWVGYLSEAVAVVIQGSWPCGGPGERVSTCRLEDCAFAKCRTGAPGSHSRCWFRAASRENPDIETPMVAV